MSCYSRWASSHQRALPGWLCLGPDCTCRQPMPYPSARAAEWHNSPFTCSENDKQAQILHHQYFLGFFVLPRLARLGFKQEVTKYHYSTKAAYFLKQMSHVGIHTSPVMSVWEQASQCCWGKQESLSELELCWRSCRESVIQQLFLNPSVSLARLYKRGVKKKNKQTNVTAFGNSFIDWKREMNSV